MDSRTAAINAILKDYPLMMDTLEEIQTTTHDEYGLKAGGFLHSLEKLNSTLSLALGLPTPFLALQKINISIQDALSAVDAAKAYYHRLRSEEEFNRFYDATVQIAEQHQIGLPFALRRLLTYLRSSMTERRLNRWLLLHIHKELTDSLYLIL